jgi:hypothetical protein
MSVTRARASSATTAFGGDRDKGFEFSELHRSSKSKRAITLVG